MFNHGMPMILGDQVRDCVAAGVCFADCYVGALV
jgi:hypothetical protein